MVGLLVGLLAGLLVGLLAGLLVGFWLGFLLSFWLGFWLACPSREEKKSNRQQHGFDTVRIRPPFVPPMSLVNPSPPNFFERLLPPQPSEHCAAGTKVTRAIAPSVWPGPMRWHHR